MPTRSSQRRNLAWPGGGCGEDAGLGAGLGIGQIAGVEGGLGDINPDGTSGAGEAGFGGDGKFRSRFDLGAA